MKKIRYCLCALLLGLVAVSCDNNGNPPEWTQAQKTDAPGIFFTGEDNILTVKVGDDTRVRIPVRRLEAGDELTVPLIVNAGHPDLIVPSEVTFARGELDSSIEVDLANIPTKQLISLNITFPDQYISPYAAGVSVFEGSVIVSDWESVTAEGTVTLEWLDWSYNPSTLLDPVEQVMEELSGTNRYRILNFLNTGVDFYFEIRPSEYPKWTGYNRVYPLGNQVLYSQYSWAGNYNPWWLVEDDLQVWPESYLSSGSSPVVLYGVSFMWYDDEYSNEYCYMRLAGSIDAYGQTATSNTLTMAFYGFYTDVWDWADFTGYMFLTINYPVRQ